LIEQQQHIDYSLSLGTVPYNVLYIQGITELYLPIRGVEIFIFSSQPWQVICNTGLCIYSGAG